MMRPLMPYIIYSLVTLGAIFLQTQFFSSLEIFGVKPDLLIIFIIVNAIKTDIGTGVLVGVLAGFIEDYLIGSYFGLNILVLGALGGVFGYLKDKIHLNTFFAHFFSVFAGTMGAGFLYALLLLIVGGNVSLWQSFVGIVIPMTFYNLLVLLIGGPLFYVIHSRWGLNISKIDLFGRGITLVRRKSGEGLGRTRRYRDYKTKPVRFTKSKYHS